MRTDASFSEDRRFRYWLLREWDPSLPKVAFIGLNPSIADENTDDPTIRRCLGFARAWGKGGLVMLNLYAFRTTYPKFLWEARKKGTDIIGGQRNWVERLQGYCNAFSCDLVIAAWGQDGKRRQDDVVPRWPGLMCLERNKDGSPKHPLYTRAILQPQTFAAQQIK